jgi:hypothetical protein
MTDAPPKRGDETQRSRESSNADGHSHQGLASCGSIRALAADKVVLRCTCLLS